MLRWTYLLVNVSENFSHVSERDIVRLWVPASLTCMLPDCSSKWCILQFILSPAVNEGSFCEGSQSFLSLVFLFWSCVNLSNSIIYQALALWPLCGMCVFSCLEGCGVIFSFGSKWLLQLNLQLQWCCSFCFRMMMLKKNLVILQHGSIQIAQHSACQILRGASSKVM